MYSLPSYQWPSSRGECKDLSTVTAADRGKYKQQHNDTHTAHNRPLRAAPPLSAPSFSAPFLAALAQTQDRPFCAALSPSPRLTLAPRPLRVPAAALSSAAAGLPSSALSSRSRCCSAFRCASLSTSSFPPFRSHSPTAQCQPRSAIRTFSNSAPRHRHRPFLLILRFRRIPPKFHRKARSLSDHARRALRPFSLCADHHTLGHRGSFKLSEPPNSSQHRTDRARKTDHNIPQHKPEIIPQMTSPANAISGFEAAYTKTAALVRDAFAFTAAAARKTQRTE